MKMRFLALCCFMFCNLQALEYEVQSENEQFIVSKVKILPSEEIGLHRDVYPQIVLALQGGTITRLEADGSSTEVHFPTGIAVFRNADPADELHKSVNKGSEPVELMVIQLKSY